MRATIRSDDDVTLVGAAEVSTEEIEELLTIAPVLVAADGGAAHCVGLSRVPRAVIGDFDSLSAEVAASFDPATLVRVAEQDSTDFEKCLQRIEAPTVLAAGFTGGRLDHELAVWNALARHADRRIVVVGRVDVAFHAPPALDLDLPAGSRLSLFPMAPVTGRSEGLGWPIAGIDFAPAGRIGTSNRVTGPVRLRFDGPGMLVFTPRAALGAVLAGLRHG